MPAKRPKVSLDLQEPAKRVRTEPQDPVVFAMDDLHGALDDLTSPLSPLSDLSEEPEETTAGPDLGPSLWRRTQENGWLLEGESERQLRSGPRWTEKAFGPVSRMDTKMKTVADSVCERILNAWPNSTEEDPRRMLWIANPVSFYDNLFKEEIERARRERENARSDKDDKEGKKKEVEERRLENVLTNEKSDTMKQQLLDKFKTIVNKSTLPGAERVRLIVKEAQKIAQQLRSARQSGVTCRTKALWIGVQRASEDQVDEWLGKRMVESAGQTKKGLESGALREDKYIRVDECMHRLCAPTDISDGKARSFILWEKSSPTDDKPEWKKVFGGVVYNLPFQDSKFSVDNDVFKGEVQAIRSTLRANASTSIERNVDDVGLMKKAPGPHASGGHTYESKVHVPQIKSKNPRPETLEKVENAKQLRLSMSRTTPIMQSRNHEFFRGFLPTFAQQEWNLSRHSPALRNALGDPKLASFATFAYCASPHLDNDDAPTSGYVMARSASVRRNESNFVWASHALVVELDESTFWTWNAPSDAHGTTMNSLALQAPRSYGKYMTSEEPEHQAQWTRVFATPHAFVQAHIRDEDE